MARLVRRVHERPCRGLGDLSVEAGVGVAAGVCPDPRDGRAACQQQENEDRPGGSVHFCSHMEYVSRKP